MMMGQGYYDYGGSSPSSSNLSALAPPFTVDRSVPKSGSNALVDLTEPFNPSLHSWLGAHTPCSSSDYFSISNPKFDSVPAYRYPSSTPHLPPLNPCASADYILYGQSSTSLLEAKPYYPSYVSPIGSDGSLAVHHHSGYDLLSNSHVSTTPNGSSNDDYTQSFSSLEHVGQWSHQWSGQVQLEGSFCSNENFICQGLYASEAMSKYGEPSHSIPTVGDSHPESACAAKLDNMSFVGENPNYLPTGNPKTSSGASTLLVPENCSDATTQRTVNPWNHQMPYSGLSEKCFRKLDASPSDSAAVINSASPAVVTNLVKNVNPKNDGDNKDFSTNYPSVVKEPHPFINSNGYVCFDASQISFHLKQSEQPVTEFSLAASVDDLDNFAKEKSGIQAPKASLDGFSSVVDRGESINSVKNQIENLDNYHPAVDSPCWKGAPVSQFSRFEVSKSTSPPKMKQFEASSGSNIQGHQIFTFCANGNATCSPEKTSKNSIPHDRWSLGNHSAVSLKGPLVSNALLRDGIHDDVILGSQYTKARCFQGVPISDDLLSNKTDNSDHKLHKGDQQCSEGGKWASDRNSAPGFRTDVEMNTNGSPDECSSHVPFHAIEHVLHSPPSDDAPVELTKAHGGESTRKMNVRKLLNTLQNLSELLEFHFSNDACELDDDDHRVLQDVIYNLDLCMLKKVEKMTSIKDSTVAPMATDQLFRKSAGLKKGTNMNEPSLSKIDPPNPDVPFTYLHVQEQNQVTDKNDKKLPSSVSLKAAAEILKDDKMTQAIRKALTENFDIEEETDSQVILYKNLWLEAEASLCSAGCLARYNQMKSEMEKSNSQFVTGLSENSVVMEKLPRSQVSTDPCTDKNLVNGGKGSPMTDTPIPDSTSDTSDLDKTINYAELFNSKMKSEIEKFNYQNGSEKLSGSKVSSDPSTNKNPVYDSNGSPTCTSISETSTIDKSKHEDDVTARFHILNSPAKNSNSDTCESEKNIKFTELPSSKISLNLKDDKLACKDKDSKISPGSQLSPDKLGPIRQGDDFESSVMARFRILKSRVENVNNVDIVEHQRADNDLRFASSKMHWLIDDDEPEDIVLNVNMESESENCTCKSTEDKISYKECYQSFKDNPMMNCPGGQFHDGSSDWEHVLLEELSGQN